MFMLLCSLFGIDIITFCFSQKPKEKPSSVLFSQQYLTQQVLAYCGNLVMWVLITKLVEYEHSKRFCMNAS